jgi:hypothetical protein
LERKVSQGIRLSFSLNKLEKILTNAGVFRTLTGDIIEIHINTKKLWKNN